MVAYHELSPVKGLTVILEILMFHFKSCLIVTPKTLAALTCSNYKPS